MERKVDVDTKAKFEDDVDIDAKVPNSKWCLCKDHSKYQSLEKEKFGKSTSHVDNDAKAKAPKIKVMLNR